MVRPQLQCLLLLTITVARAAPLGEQLFPAMYVFGDSLSDPGNNVNFSNSLAKANFWPYGIDIQLGPTGRFSNGKIIVDLLAELLGLPLLPSYVNTVTKGDDISSGVNYASAGAGILDNTGSHFGRVIPLAEQIENFQNTINQLRNLIPDNELENYLAKALTFVQIGVNDYINNYLLPPVSRISHMYTPQQFADLLIKLYSDNILNLQSLGLRKFYLVELPPAGCMPAVLRIGVNPPGECETITNDMVQMFNDQLKDLVDQLNSDNPGSVFSRGAAFQLFKDLRDNADAYGFRVIDDGCCGVIRDRMSKLACLPNMPPCSNRNEYLFWDFAHLTEAANRILIGGVYNNTNYNFPYTIEEMARI